VRLTTLVAHAEHCLANARVKVRAQKRLVVRVRSEEMLPFRRSPFQRIHSTGTSLSARRGGDRLALSGCVCGGYRPCRVTWLTRHKPGYVRPGKSNRCHRRDTRPSRSSACSYRSARPGWNSTQPCTCPAAAAPIAAEVVKHQADQAVDGPRVPDADIIPPSPADATRLLEAARGHQYEHMFALLLTTGLRRWPARRCS